MRLALVVVVTLFVSACGGGDCSSTTLFRSWTLYSFDPRVAGAQPLATFDMTGGKYGDANAVLVGQCSFRVDIEKTGGGGHSESGTFKLFSPNPDSCASLAVAGDYSLCTTLTLSTLYDVAVYR